MEDEAVKLVVLKLETIRFSHTKLLLEHVMAIMSF